MVCFGLVPMSADKRLQNIKENKQALHSMLYSYYFCDIAATFPRTLNARIATCNLEISLERLLKVSLSSLVISAPPGLLHTFPDSMQRKLVDEI